MVFGRSRLYFFIKVFFPLLFLAAATALALVLIYIWLEGEYFSYFVGAFVLCDIVWLVPIIGKHIDYKLDFIVATPDLLIMYDQEWIFKRNVTTINEKSIKTISVRKHGFLDSIFNNWDIIFLSEWDTNYGDITLRRVAKPEKRRNEIARIMSKDAEDSH